MCAKLKRIEAKKDIDSYILSFIQEVKDLPVH